MAIQLLYCFNNEVDGLVVDEYLPLLPISIHTEITRYRNVNDQRVRLLARLIIHHALKRDNALQLFNKWERDNFNKPQIAGWKFFNISHSKTLVTVAFGDSPVGIDVEKIREINIDDLIGQFHPEEREYIQQSGDRLTTFYQIWAKKEALLKATGKGLLDDLTSFSCVDDTLLYNNQRWFLQRIAIDPEYMCYVCMDSEDEEVVIEEFAM
ncbi:4'-phosphopantetheinyl transferase superfamily protein [Mucilaginibacter gynuensis]|uniref:4'-phosphopantetheinyl transferase superfamily protein n=1 Tax=Mucilaginibacter gynuensis TaxID=1302236 RepID=A0ABP8G4D4_9SPHI